MFMYENDVLFDFMIHDGALDFAVKFKIEKNYF